MTESRIDNASRCSLYEGEARVEGLEDCAQVFGELAVKEREGIEILLESLREHLDHRETTVG